ncbi:metallophosphoesterase [Candidatus Pacearchaeota archaeon]|nr:metallophosphoesterase [Candidatus Pacearchaeota archaeon]
MKSNYILISKSIFFPSSGILAIGDLHLGYEQMLKQQGIQFPFNQLEQTKKELKEIIEKIGKKKIKKIILLGDIKHYFSFDKREFFEIINFFNFLEKFVKKENIILIRGNHDKIEIKNYKYQNYYIEKDLCFTHGNFLFPEILNKKIKTIVMGHVHPAVYLKDKSNVKREKFKAFLIGKWKNKTVIVVPSFFPMVEGTDIDEEYYREKGWSIVGKDVLKKFKTYLIDEKTGKVYDFGKLNKIR